MLLPKLAFIENVSKISLGIAHLLFTMSLLTTIELTGVAFGVVLERTLYDVDCGVMFVLCET